MKKSLYIIIALLSYFCSYGQKADSLPYSKFVKEINENKKLKDSLEKAFYGNPPCFSIKLEINQKNQTIPQSAKFYILDNATKIYSKAIGENRYQLLILPDSGKFVLEWDSVKIETGTIKKTQYNHGADFKFGYYDNILDIRSLWESNRKNDDFDEYTNIGQPYLRALKNKKLLRAAKRKIIKSIEFVIFNPRAYDDGIVITFENIKMK